MASCSYSAPVVESCANACNDCSTPVLSDCCGCEATIVSEVPGYHACLDQGCSICSGSSVSSACSGTLEIVSEVAGYEVSSCPSCGGGGCATCGGEIVTEGIVGESYPVESGVIYGIYGSDEGSVVEGVVSDGGEVIHDGVAAPSQPLDNLDAVPSVAPAADDLAAPADESPAVDTGREAAADDGGTDLDDLVGGRDELTPAPAANEGGLDDLGNIFDTQPVEPADGGAVDDPAVATPDPVTDDPLDDLPGDAPAGGFDEPVMEPAGDDGLFAPDDAVEPGLPDDGGDMFDTPAPADLPGEGLDAPPADDPAGSIDDIFGGSDAVRDDAVEPATATEPADMFDAAPAEIDAQPAATDELFESLESPAKDDVPAADEATENIDDLFGITTQGDRVRFTATTKNQKPTAQTLAQGQMPVRKWVDNTGNFETHGRLVKIGDNFVQLLKENGRYAKVSFDRLSDSDLHYVQDLASRMGQPLVRVAGR